ncbi:MAG: glycyl-radical enzyme activating protein [Chitinophagales bacterium]
MRKPLILELKGNSLDDGPGIRTVVFFKGCPLDCLWCHNPESKRPEAEISFAAGDCIACDTCLETCPSEALSRDNPFYVNRSKCNLCFDCADACPTGALSRTGKEMTSDQILEFILRDMPFFDVSGGGVTLSGGEPTMYMEFCGELLQKLQASGINTLLETCGQFNFDHFRRLVLPHTNIIYYDLKIFDNRQHQNFCGVGNKLILENLVKLQRLSMSGEFSLLPRTPLIPDITDTDENLCAIAQFLQEQGVKSTRLLLYNPLWYEKNDKLGITNRFSQRGGGQRWQPPEKVLRCESIFRDRGISV